MDEQGSIQDLKEMSHTALVVESMFNEVLSEWNEEFNEKEIIPDFYGAPGQGLSDYSYNPPLSEYRWGVGNNIWTLRDQEPAAQALRSSTGIDMDQGLGSTQDLKEMSHTALLIRTMINEVLSEWDEKYLDEKEIISPDFHEVLGQGMNYYGYNPPLSEYRWGVGNNIRTLQDHKPAAQALRSSSLINTPYQITTHEKHQVDDQQLNVADQKPNCKREAITSSDMLVLLIPAYLLIRLVGVGNVLSLVFFFLRRFPGCFYKLFRFIFLPSTL